MPYLRLIDFLYHSIPGLRVLKKKRRLPRCYELNQSPFGLGRFEREFFIENLLVRIHFIIVMIRWTGLAPWEFEFSFQGSLTSTFPCRFDTVLETAGEQQSSRCGGGE